jgi:hypothetical protein
MKLKRQIMKKLLALFIAVLNIAFVFAQGGGNVIYDQNNRYIQNKTYNADAEQMWDIRGDNMINDQLMQSANNNEMIFTVNALMNTKADSYLAIFNITQTGSTAKEVNDLVNAKI